MSDIENLQRVFLQFITQPMLGWVALILGLAALAIALRRARTVASLLGTLFMVAILSTPFFLQHHQQIAEWWMKTTPTILKRISEAGSSNKMPTMLEVNECFRKKEPRGVGLETRLRLFNMCAQQLAAPISTSGNIAISDPDPSHNLRVDLLNRNLVVVEFDASLEWYDEFGAKSVLANWQRDSVQEVGGLRLSPSSVFVGSSEYVFGRDDLYVPLVSGVSAAFGKFAKLEQKHRCREARTSPPRNCWRVNIKTIKGFLLGDWPRVRARYSSWTSSTWMQLRECISEHSWAAHKFVDSNERTKFKCAEALSSELPSEAYPEISVAMQTYHKSQHAPTCWQRPCPEFRPNYALTMTSLEIKLASSTAEYLITGVDLDIIVRDAEGRPRTMLPIKVSPLWLESRTRFSGIDLKRSIFSDPDWKFLSDMHSDLLTIRDGRRPWNCSAPGSDGRYCWDIVVRRATGVEYSASSGPQ
jgi:hypothetical protein